MGITFTTSTTQAGGRVHIAFRVIQIGSHMAQIERLPSVRTIPLKLNNTPL